MKMKEIIFRESVKLFKENTRISPALLMRKFKITHDFASEIMRKIRLECHKEARKIVKEMESKEK